MNVVVLSLTPRGQYFDVRVDGCFQFWTKLQIEQAIAHGANVTGPKEVTS